MIYLCRVCNKLIQLRIPQRQFNIAMCCGDNGEPNLVVAAPFPFPGTLASSLAPRLCSCFNFNFSFSAKLHPHCVP